MESLDLLLERVTQKYITILKSAPPKSTEVIRAELYEATANEIEVANAVRPKGFRFTPPKTLVPYQIAEVILAIKNVISIACAGESRNRDYNVLGVYESSGPNEGTYNTTDTAIEGLISQFNTSITEKELKETISRLKWYAPEKRRCENRDLIAVNNGIFDYQNKVLLPFSPDFVFLTKSRVNYNPNPANPIIHNPVDGTDWDVESWLKEVVPDDEVRQLIWEVLGAIIRPFVRWGKAIWFYSEMGNNGKGSLCALMRNLCGPGSYASIPLSQFGDRFALEPLLRATAIIVDENAVGQFIDDAANLKAVITSDVVQIDRKFKAHIPFQFHGIMIQCLNEMPRVRDRSDSFYRRQLFIPFMKCFTGAERKYIKDDYLNRPEVLEYVLWKVLDTDYYELSEPKACKSALAEYKSCNDMVLQFLEEILPQSEWDFLPIGYVFDLYKAWMKSDNSSGTTLGKKNFIKEVARHIEQFPEWEYKSTPLSPGNMLDYNDPLANEYDLAKWMNLRYNGTLRTGYRCLLRVAPKAGSGSNDDEEKAS